MLGEGMGGFGATGPRRVRGGSRAALWLYASHTTSRTIQRWLPTFIFHLASKVWYACFGTLVSSAMSLFPFSRLSFLKNTFC